MEGLADADTTGGPDLTAGDDIAFRIARPRPSLIANVGIDSVLYPLYGRVDDPERRHPQAYRLIGLWRDRITELVRNGWDPAPGPDRPGRPGGCPGSATAARRSSRSTRPAPAGSARSAPSARAREAMRIWSVADAVLFPPDPRSGRRPEQPACGLVETARTHRLPGSDPRLLAAFLADRVRRPPRGMPVGPYFRPHEMQTYPILGGYETIAVSADARGRGPGPWEVAIRQLLAVAPEHVGLLQAAAVQEDPHPRRSAQPARPEGPGPRRGAAVPLSPWLLRGDPEQVLDSLAARAGLRLGAAFGNFRGARPGAGTAAARRTGATR